LIKSYQQAQGAAKVLKDGDAVIGQIEDIRQNLNVQVNGRHPWTVVYSFELDDKSYQDRVTTLTRPEMGLHPGKKVYVLYMPDDPELSTIYPHPYGYYST